jgi:hypothetical protein
MIRPEGGGIPAAGERRAIRRPVTMRAAKPGVGVPPLAGERRAIKRRRPGLLPIRADAA